MKRMVWRWLCIGMVSVLAACASAPSTKVSADEPLGADEGLVALRLVNLGQSPVQQLSVKHLATDQVYALRAQQFGQTVSGTYLGRLPAGRYQPTTLVGWEHQYGSNVTSTIRLEKLTGQFEVQAQRITDLQTMVLAVLEEQTSDEQRKPGGGRAWKTAIVLPLDPTPVPAQELVKARFPQWADRVTGYSPLNWVPGSVPTTPRGVMSLARARVDAVRNPRFVTPNLLAIGGAAGVVDTYEVNTDRFKRVYVDSVHGIESVLVLQDGRWLVGGENGYLGLSSDAGKTWKKLSGLSAEDAVLHLEQAPTGKVYVVSDRDKSVVVHEASPVDFKLAPVKQLDSDRALSVWNGAQGQSRLVEGSLRANYAASARDRLVVFSQPDQLHTMDFKTGVWQTAKAPRSFSDGIKVTPDGQVVGFVHNYAFITDDQGQNWRRMEHWLNMTRPHFANKQKGLLMVADGGVLSAPKEQHLYTTEDGGRTWVKGHKTAVLPGIQLGGAPQFWTDPSGQVLFTMKIERFLSVSRDQGVTWRHPWNKP